MATPRPATREELQQDMAALFPGQQPAQVSPAAGAISSWPWYQLLYEGMVRGIVLLPAEAQAQLVALFRPATLWALLLIIGAWAGAQFVPILGELADLGVIAYGVYSISGSIFSAGGDLYHYGQTALRAKSFADLDQAGKYFAAAVGEIGITALEAFVGGKLFRGASAAIARLKPVPAGARFNLAEDVRARARTAERAAEAPAERPPGEQPPAEQPPREKTPAEKLRERVKEATDRAKTAAGGVGLAQGAKDLADNSGSWLAALALLLGVGYAAKKWRGWGGR